jgi:hypothetical protein
MQIPLGNIIVNNMKTVLGTLKITTEHYKQIGVELSESAILKTRRRHLAVEIAMTSFPQ